MIKNKSYFTIDFEDFKYDFLNKRSLAIKRSPEGLYESYGVIKKILDNHDGNNKCTFFCTGNVAKHEPDLIKQISTDGHEIACHSNEHKDISKQSNYQFEKDIDEAINYLSIPSKNVIKGYRAPMFSLQKNDSDKYKILSKHFVYDSSLVCTIDELPSYLTNNRVHGLDLIEFPIIKKMGFPFNLNMIGGTYLKISNIKDVKKWFKNDVYKDFWPIIYMHPYEFLDNKPFWVKFSDLKKMNIFENLYFQIKQNQWHSFNKKNIKKIHEFLMDLPNKGRLMDDLKK